MDIISITILDETADSIWIYNEMDTVYMLDIRCNALHNTMSSIASCVLEAMRYML